MPRYSQEVKKAVVDEYKHGATARQLALKYKVDKSTVLDWVRKLAGNSAIKEPNGYADSLKAQAIQDYLQGFTSTDLSKKYNVDSKTITIWVKNSGHKTRTQGSQPLAPKQTIEEKKAHRELNKEKIYEYNRRWHRQNRAYMRQQSQIYRNANKDKRRAYFRQDKYKVKARARTKLRWRLDPQFRLRVRLRARVRSALKVQCAKKAKPTLDLVGCSLKDLQLHLTSMFTEGMTWDLLIAGKIHIDHIRPCSSFDLTDPEQQKLCFNFKNLQPLWPIDNHIKGDKWSENTKDTL